MFAVAFAVVVFVVFVIIAVLLLCFGFFFFFFNFLATPAVVYDVAALLVLFLWQLSRGTKSSRQNNICVCVHAYVCAHICLFI